MLTNFERKLENETAFDGVVKIYSLKSNNNELNKLLNGKLFGDFIFPSKIGEYYRLIDNRKSQVFCDKVNYAIKVKEDFKEDSDIIFALMNSMTFRYFVDLFARQLTGAQTLSDVDVNVVERTIILKPELLRGQHWTIKSIVERLKSREQSAHLSKRKSRKENRDNREMPVLRLLHASFERF